MDAAGIPGLSLAVIDSGAVDWTAAYGVKNVATGEPVDRNTVFEAASLSKPVLAYAALRMVARGELDLDEPLWNVLAYDRLRTDERGRRITPRLVLTHTTGLPNWGGTPLEFVRDPGDSWGYSGEGFVFLQRALETKTGRSLDEIARREVFEPLGMTRSSYVWIPAYDSLAATPHDLLGDPREKNKPAEANGAASLHTTADDYARFVAAVIKGEGLPAQLADSMIAPLVPVDNWGAEDRRAGLFWGLGWGIQQGERGQAIWHWGDNGNFRCYVIAYPEEGRGLVYFTNSFNGLSIAEDVVTLVVEDTHPAIAWLDYDRYDDPLRRGRIELRRAYLQNGIHAALDVIHEVAAADEELAAAGLIDLGSFALDRGASQDAVSIFRIAVYESPTAANWFRLAEAATAAGEYRVALDAYERAVSLDPERVEELRPRIEWLEEGLAAAAQPLDLSPDQLAAYVGSYGPRHIALEDGSLYYQRQGATARTRLLPLTRELFALESTDTFRIRFVFDEDGRPVKIIGLYSDGRTDESPRDDMP